jgi:hypothetical protein
MAQCRRCAINGASEEWADIQHALRTFVLLRSEIMRAGGRKVLIATRFDSLLIERGWTEKQFDTAIAIDGAQRNAPTHKVHCYKNAVALGGRMEQQDRVL